MAGHVTGVTSSSHLILSNGLVNQAKRLDRVVKSFARVVAKHANTYFLILGREHPTEPLKGNPTPPVTPQRGGRVSLACKAGIQDII